MGKALRLSNIDTKSFKGARCWEKHDNKIKHILRAQELANWINEKSNIFGIKKIYTRRDYKNVTSENFWNIKGIIFFEDGWGPTDHIDIWTGTRLIGGSNDYFTSNWKKIWIWQLI